MTGPRSRWLRVGGRWEREGSGTTWSVAEGRRGRRWRSVSVDRSGALRAMLIEADPDGRPVRLELATSRGLLTMHPDGEPPRMHGNVVDAAGVRPIALRWGPDHLLVVDGEPLSIAVAVQGLRHDLGMPRVLPVLFVDAALAVEERVWHVERVTSASWRTGPTDGSPGEVLVEIDEDGLPRAIDDRAVDATRWPLEDG